MSHSNEQQPYMLSTRIHAELAQLGVALELVQRGCAGEEELHLLVAREVLSGQMTVWVLGGDGDSMLQEPGQMISGEFCHADSK